MFFAWEDEEPSFTLAEADQTLNCATTEGEQFTAKVVAIVLNLDKDDLIDFFDDFLSPYEMTKTQTTMNLALYVQVIVLKGLIHFSQIDMCGNMNLLDYFCIMRDCLTLH